MMSREGARGQETTRGAVKGVTRPSTRRSSSHAHARRPDGFTRHLRHLDRAGRGGRGAGRAPRPDDAREAAGTVLVLLAAQRRRISRELRASAGVPVHPDVAVDWDTTRVVAGKIGDYVVVARRERNGPSCTSVPSPREARTFDVPCPSSRRAQIRRGDLRGRAGRTGSRTAAGPISSPVDATRACTSCSRPGRAGDRIRPAR